MNKNLNYVFSLLIALALSGCCATSAKAPTPLPIVIANQPIHVVVDNQSPAAQPAAAKYGALQPRIDASTGTAAAPNPTVSITPGVETPVGSPPMLRAPATTTAPITAVSGSGTVIDLSKETLQASKATVPNGSVILRKTVVTNIVQVPVPVRREEYEVVHVPVPQGTSASAFENKQIQMDLSKEVPVGQVTGQLVDRVELRKVVKTDEPVVSGEVRTENVEVVPVPASK